MAKQKVPPLGMPAARPFHLEADRDNAERTPLFVVRYNNLALGYEEMVACGLRNEYGAFESRDVLGFTHAEMETLLKRNGHIMMAQRYGSTQPNVEWVKLERELSFPDDMNGLFQKEAMLQYPFETRNFNGCSQSKFSYLLSRMLGPVVKRKILFDTPHGYQKPYQPRGAFQVHVYSTPHGDDFDHAPRKIWGYDVYSRDAFVPEGVKEDAGVLIKDGDYAVAELFENALYIHHDLVHSGTDNEFRIMARLLQEVVKILDDPEVFAEELRKARTVFMEAQQKLFERIVQGSIPKRTQRTNTQLVEARENADRLRKEYFEANRHLFGLQNALLDPKVVAGRFREELEKLQQGKVACVEKVVLNGDDDRYSELEVYTTELTARYPREDTEYLLGRYRIVLRLDYDADCDGLITMFNLDRQPEGNHHPHVEANGRPCLGNLSTELPEYVAHFEIEAAITLAIAFLQTLTRDDNGYISISYFPVVPPKDKKEDS